MKYARAVLAITTFAVLIFCFENCSQFEMSTQAIKNFSSSCMAKARAQTKTFIAPALCDDLANYSCERRIFRPGIAASDTTKLECDANDVCVRTRTLSFDTSVARSGASAEQFADGGDYNREDIECIHDAKTNDISLIQATGESVFSALALTIEKCRERSLQ